MAKSYNKSIFSKLPMRDSLIMFLAVFIAELIGGIYFSYFKGILLNDAFSRTANAFYVLYVKPFRLASIGFVWNPLPSIFQLPFVELSKIWRPIVSSGISAVIVTAASSAFSALLLFRVFTRFNISKKYSICIILLYVTNPFIFFYGMNGMSEETFFAAVIYIVANMTLWMREGSPEYIIKIAFGLTFAFFCRYEAMPFAAAVGIGVLINIFFSEKEKKFIPSNIKREKYHYAEGTAIVLYAPMIYGILLWIFLNWTITGNPLYFLNSVYSNTSQSQLTTSIESPIKAIEYVIQRAIPFLPLFFAFILIRSANKKIFKSDFFILCILVVTMLVFHFLMLVKGSSYGWFRFFSYSLPICIAWLPYELSGVKKIFRPTVFKILCAALIISSILTGRALSDPVIAVEEHYVLANQEGKEISEYINEELPDEKIMMDSFLTSAIILNVKNIDNLVVSSSLNFNQYLDNPAKYGINYIIVPDPDDGIGSLDAFNRRYHYLYKDGADWCTLKKEFEGYKIFQIKD
ncbi:hypothetical protein J2Z42_002239 [Clostridium algifaecis]|uniref:Glycosyltransferase RgtA/B/C/D-like domain-containing protein n=1 Tax=Clostridium algifaecis TaxID=1472040 RepID=A0ABS4KVK7_9CLOT|nr:hypothetical protein [Clostridium algifaecis]MBP2033536.1 hypothetical protein [Clostridium algifaecis]